MLKRWGIFYGWVVVFAIATLSFGAVGSRFAFAAFLKPMTEEFGWDRAALTGAASLNLLLAGLLRPVGGWLVDRYGPKKMAIGGLIATAVFTFMFSFITELWQAYAVFALLSVALVAGPVATIKLVGSWFVRRRALAFSLSSTGASLGELIIVPFAMWMVVVSSWQVSYQALALLLFLLVPIGLLCLSNSPAEKGTYPDGTEPGATAASGHGAARQAGNDATLRQALRTGTFWKLGTGFFVCGLTMGFAVTHLIAFATDHDFDPMVAAASLSLVGLFSIVGSVGLGYVSDHVERKYVLAAVYFLRALAYVFLIGADSPMKLYLASFFLGVSWTATNPLTSAISVDLWGLKSIGVIFGTLFMIMPIGSAIGASFAAWVFDTQGNYDQALWVNIAAGLIASIAIFTIKEKSLVAGGKKSPAAA